MTTLPRDNLRGKQPLSASKDWNPLAKLVRGLAGSGNDLGFADDTTGVHGRRRITNARPKPFIVTAHLAGGYRVQIYDWKHGLDTAVAYDLTTDVDGSRAYDATVVNTDDSGIGTHRIGIGAMHVAWFTGDYDDAGYERWIAFYHHVIRFIRFNETTGWIQTTSQNKATAADVDEGAWEDAIQFGECPDETPAVAAADSNATLAASLITSDLAETLVAIDVSNSENTELMMALLETLDGIRYAILHPA